MTEVLIFVVVLFWLMFGFVARLMFKTFFPEEEGRNPVTTTIVAYIFGPLLFLKAIFSTRDTDRDKEES